MRSLDSAPDLDLDTDSDLDSDSDSVRVALCPFAHADCNDVI